MNRNKIPIRSRICTRALRGIKNPVQWVEQGKQLNRKINHVQQVIGIAQEMFNFIKETATEKEPRMTKLCTISVVDTPGARENVLVNMWAATGNDNPIQRIETLRNQRNEYERLLLISMERELTEAEKNEVKLLLKICV